MDKHRKLFNDSRLQCGLCENDGLTVASFMSAHEDLNLIGSTLFFYFYLTELLQYMYIFSEDMSAYKYVLISSNAYSCERIVDKILIMCPLDATPRSIYFSNVSFTFQWATGDPFNGFPTLPMPNNQGLPSGLNNMFPITNTIEDRFVSSPGVNNQFPRGNGAINQFSGVNGAFNQIPGDNGAINQFPATNGAINQFPRGNGAINQISGLNGDLSQFPGSNGPFSQFPNTIDLNNQLAASRDAQWNNGLSGLPSGAINGNPAFSSGSALGSSWSAPPRTTGVTIPGAQNNGLQWAGQNRPWKK